MSVTNTELRADIKALHQDIRENNSLLVGFEKRLRKAEINVNTLEAEQRHIKDGQTVWNRGLLILNVVIGAVTSALGMSTRS